jgi:hypothetical protein
MEGPTAHDSTGRQNDAFYEPGIAFYLPGPELPGLTHRRQPSRAAHLAGGRIISQLAIPGEAYSIEFWFWNGLLNDARSLTAYLFARTAGTDAKEVIGLSGASGPLAPGRIFVTVKDRAKIYSGNTEILPKTWHHVVLSRTGQRVAVYVDGCSRPEIVADSREPETPGVSRFFVGGRDDRDSTFEGKMDEIAVYDRSLSLPEITQHFNAAAIE